MSFFSENFIVLKNKLYLLELVLLIVGRRQLEWPMTSVPETLYLYRGMFQTILLSLIQTNKMLWMVCFRCCTYNLAQPNLRKSSKLILATWKHHNSLFKILTHQNCHLSIYTLLVWVFDWLYPITIGPNFLLGPHMIPGKVYGCSKLLNLYL